jgi:hypothetical protein
MFSNAAFGAARRMAQRVAFSTGRQQQRRAAPEWKNFLRFGVGATATAAAAATVITVKTDLEDAKQVAITIGDVSIASLFKYHKELAAIADVKASNPDNLAMKHFDYDYFLSLSPELQARFIKCVRTGFENPDSGLGLYAMTPSDYEVFAPFFDAVCQEYHRADPSARHETDWDASGVGDHGVLDVTKLGLSELSMRVRVGRNLAAFNLPGAMDKDERIRFEKRMLLAFAALQADPDYGGNVYSLSPDLGGEPNPNLISDAKYQQLVKSHVMFKDMDADPYLKSAGISSDWPYGRGCYVSEDGQCIIWFGEEDQLRIMCMKKGTKLNEVFDRLKKMLDTVESIPGIEFAKSEKYGYVTSCPSNLGTGMRASVHVKIPNLCADGTDTKAKAVCKPLGLSVRGTGGEHTPIGADGTVDISPSARLFIKERDIIAALYQGISDLMVAEKQAAK